MTIDLEQYNQLKKKANILKSKADRAEGVLETLMKKLKDDFDCESLEDAEDLFKQLRQQEDKAERSFKKALREFEDKWSEKLEAIL